MKITQILGRGERKETLIAITPIGQQKLQTYSGTNLEFRALEVLAEEGATSVRRLADRLQIDPDKAKYLANTLIREGWARRVE